jgi:hypothetical protein
MSRRKTSCTTWPRSAGKKSAADHGHYAPVDWVALRCRDPLFWRFLQVKDEPSAVHVVRTLCEVKSRAEFDRDPEAIARLNQIIRRPFIEFSTTEGST